MLVAKKNIDIDGVSIPLFIYKEKRSGWRFSIVKAGGVNVRIPLFYTPEQEANTYKELENWLRRTLSKKKNLVQRFEKKEYNSGDTLQVGKRQYGIDIVHENRTSHTVKLLQNMLFFKIAESDNLEGKQKAIRQLMSRMVAQDFLPEISRRVHEINHLHFRKNIKSINFKYNHSNWGSCSRTGNINFSTRLLFAPDDVIDYVIVHELSHLIEMNHSPLFWKVVEDVMPDYEQKEAWLKKNGSLCDF